MHSPSTEVFLGVALTTFFHHGEHRELWEIIATGFIFEGSFRQIEHAFFPKIITTLLRVKYHPAFPSVPRG
jgi:hypothetical protein